MNAVPHLFMVCTVNMTRLRQHWQIRNTTALPRLSTVTGCSKCVWTEELSDLGLQPQARTHGTGMASLPRALCALLMKVRYTQFKEHNRTDGWMTNLNSARFERTLHEQWDAAAPRLPDGRYLWVRGCSWLASSASCQWTCTQHTLI